MKHGSTAKSRLFALYIVCAYVFPFSIASGYETQEMQQITSDEKANGRGENEKRPERNTESTNERLLGNEPNAADTNKHISEADAQESGEKISDGWIILGHPLGITDTLLVVFTAGLLVATILLFLAGFWQGWLFRDASRRELRAYLTIAGSGRIPGTKDTYQIEIINSGKTPAYDVKSWRWIAIIEIPPTKVPGPPVQELTQANIVLGPDRSYFIRAKRKLPPTEEQLQQIKNGTHALCVWGEIEYRDAFGKRRHTKFFLQEDRDAGVDSGLKHAPVGNDAD